MKLKITITMDNDAFKPFEGTEAARLLRELAKSLDGSCLKRALDTKFMVKDINGCLCGYAQIIQ